MLFGGTTARATVRTLRIRADDRGLRPVLSTGEAMECGEGSPEVRLSWDPRAEHFGTLSGAAALDLGGPGCQSQRNGR
jgi:hypothetical protein